MADETTKPTDDQTKDATKDQAAAVEGPKVPKPPTCPTCKNPLVVYEGTNPDKVSTGFCDTCGARRPLKG